VIPLGAESRLRIPVASEGWPFILPLAMAACIMGWMGWWAAAAVFGVAALACLGFFRDPDRTPPEVPGAVLAPADGRVMAVVEATDPWVGQAVRVSIFLSPLDVHINRTPVDGRVTRIEYRPGAFLPAYKHDAAANELNEIWIDHGGETVVVRQIVGALARRIVCRVEEGQTLARGERIGLMKFGSRMDVFLPPRAELMVQVGQSVVAGVTVLARLQAPPHG